MPQSAAGSGPRRGRTAAARRQAQPRGTEGRRDCMPRAAGRPNQGERRDRQRRCPLTAAAAAGRWPRAGRTRRQDAMPRAGTVQRRLRPAPQRGEPARQGAPPPGAVLARCPPGGGCARRAPQPAVRTGARCRPSTPGPGPRSGGRPGRSRRCRRTPPRWSARRSRASRR